MTGEDASPARSGIARFLEADDDVGLSTDGPFGRGPVAGEHKQALAVGRVDLQAQRNLPERHYGRNGDPTPGVCRSPAIIGGGTLPPPGHRGRSGPTV